MGTFIGTVEEFLKHQGPKMRNSVQNKISKPLKKKAKGRCMKCKRKTSELHAAHLHGRERNDIARSILSRHMRNGKVRVDLDEFMEKFIHKHEPLEKTLIILCKKCHNEYDQKQGTKDARRKIAHKINVAAQGTRIFTNAMIQRKISAVAKKLSNRELESLCRKTSRRIFSIAYPLFVRVPVTASESRRNKAIRDDNGNTRWSWTYSFVKNGYQYAICTEWFQRNDRYVKQWLLEKKI